MFVLGWAVGKHSTTLDSWFPRFGHGPAQGLLFFTDPWILATVLAGGVAVALYRQRWRLATVMVASPVVAIGLVELLKRFFARHKGTASLAYPSGHTAAAVVVMGMIVVLAGAAAWSLLVAVAVSLLGAIGQAITYHYFTDTVGAALLGTAVVCVAALVAET